MERGSFVSSSDQVADQAHRPNPYSALERFPPEAQKVPQSAPARSWLPWWLSPLALVLVGAIESYRRFLPNHLKRHCIYVPTCSQYGLECVKKYGGVRGSIRTWARIRRCNGAMFSGGEDLP